jgi:hypothetical protein
LTDGHPLSPSPVPQLKASAAGVGGVKASKAPPGAADKGYDQAGAGYEFAGEVAGAGDVGGGGAASYGQRYWSTTAAAY